MEIFTTNTDARMSLLEFGSEWLSLVIKEENVILKKFAKSGIKLVGDSNSVKRAKRRLENGFSVSIIIH